MNNLMIDVRHRPALQQPVWIDPGQVRKVRDELARLPPLVDAQPVKVLRTLLSRVAAGEAQVVQCGDCAEDPAECSAGDVARKAAVLDLLAGAMKMNTGKPVLRVGRIAGQFAKPRSQPVEHVGGLELPVFRGHLVNSPEPDPEGRKPAPQRLLAGYRAARQVLAHLGWPNPTFLPGFEPPVWTSHEVLLLDYELPMVRPVGDGRLLLTSTHWPWIGERTRQHDGAHVALLSRVVNPVACKIGPRVTADELLFLCERLDPEREPGRLTLIVRMGADVVVELLPSLVTATRAAGHPVIWLCDPMHANTVVSPNGLKTRYLESIKREIRGFQQAVLAGGAVAGGLHLETTPDDVVECVPDKSHVDQVGDKYASLCDPRLNPRQALSVISAWH